MGIITNLKDKAIKKPVDSAKRAADGIAVVSSLSPQEAEKITAKRNEYLELLPDMDSQETMDRISRNLGAVGIEVYQAYLSQLKNSYTTVDIGIDEFKADNRIRFFDITRWVISPDEKNLDKLVNVYQVLSEEDCNIGLIYHRSVIGCTVTIGVVDTDLGHSDAAVIEKYCERIQNAIKGNFPGATLSQVRAGIPTCLKNVIHKENNTEYSASVAIVSNLASEKSENFISQSMEKLLDGIVPEEKSEEYTIVLLAKPIRNQLEKESRLFDLYSFLSPYSSWQTSYTFTESDSAIASAGVGICGGANIGGSVGTDDAGRVNFGVQFSGSFNRNSSSVKAVGDGRNLTKSYCNFNVQHTLKIIEAQIKRLEESSALGMWEFSAYVISEKPAVANNVAHTYMALTQGEQSYMTQASINLWDGENPKETDNCINILRYIQRLWHPVFALDNSKVGSDKEWLLYPSIITPSADISGKELARSLNFPAKSVSGLPVIASAAFGREVHAVDGILTNAVKKKAESIPIGNIFHMYSEEKQEVTLDIDSIASHVFITGSTGTGKSNVIYQTLRQLMDRGIHFLVIEPAKGEYKKVFGDKAAVFGTNPNICKLLRINPFSFPKDILVLEHIDRLVEIFNSCWPMYAAMPAVLKDAIEKSYERVGWNLRYSTCEPRRFPSFYDLMEVLPEVMDSSLYSGDTKSDYAGALITRIRSLTNGINGQIFCSGREESAKSLFDGNVIVDLSRVGSSETKSLMMGILVMKLQEYRLQQDKMNDHLTHVTVLEEAHNLIRKTSFGQTQESANIQGKSVEMITNSIAEMRTYGEGFIIADQAPDLLDEAVIRNTNTKIALRLPDDNDRCLVGKSMALTDVQIAELAKLPMGVAAVYQNNWIEAVLCHFEKYQTKYAWAPQPDKQSDNYVEKYMNKAFGGVSNQLISREDADSLKNWIESLKVAAHTKELMYYVLENKALDKGQQKIVAYNLLGGKKIGEILRNARTEKEGVDNVRKKIKSQLGISSDVTVNNLLSRVMEAIFAEKAGKVIAERYKPLMTGGRLI